MKRTHATNPPTGPEAVERSRRNLDRPNAADGLPNPQLPERSQASLPTIRSKWDKQHRALLRLRQNLLEERRARVRDSAQEMSAYSMHMADAAADQFERDLALGLLSAHQDALNEVEEAIGRIKNSTYGICELSGKPIPKERLAAVPWTRFTAEAERRLEQERAIKLPRLGTLHRVADQTAQNLALARSPEEIESEERVSETSDLSALVNPDSSVQHPRHEEEDQSGG